MIFFRALSDSFIKGKANMIYEADGYYINGYSYYYIKDNVIYDGNGNGRKSSKIRVADYKNSKIIGGHDNYLVYVD